MDVVPKGAAPGNTRKRLFADLGRPSDTEFTELSEASGKRSRVDSNSNKREAPDSDTSSKVWDWFERPDDTERDELEGIDERERELRTKVLLKAPDGPYVSCRSELSSRVYFRVRDELSDSQLEDSLGKVGKLDSLLFTIVCDVTELARREALFDAVRDATFKKLDSENESNWCMATSDDDSQPDRKTGPGCNALWLDRYTPRRYLDLVSDEQMNRRVLRWLKTWDAVVHGYKSERPAGGKQSAAGSFDDQFSRLDDRGAPYWKVLVLVGPPGCGKTTLAHVAARHAGYLPVEVNASDDRSTSVFRERLEAALEFRAALSNKSLQVAAESHAKLPICLVLDEIDGAPPASVKLLVDRVKADAGGKAASCKSTNSDSDSDAESGQGDEKADVRKKKRSKPIRRPVIAICNDVYATSLRTLRRVALVVRCGTPDSRALVDRLAQIAVSERVLLSDAGKRNEQLEQDSEEEEELVEAPAAPTLVDRSLLERVARLHNFDIRSSLNALQFVVATTKQCRSGDSALVGDVGKGEMDALVQKLATMSHKDAQDATSNNLFQVGNVLFNLNAAPPSKPARTNANTNASQNQSTSTTRNFTSLFSFFDAALFGGRDQLERLLFTAFENYTHFPLRDSFMQKYAQIADAFCFNEQISTLVFASQCYALQMYQAMTFVLIALLYSATRTTRFVSRLDRSRSVPAAPSAPSAPSGPSGPPSSGRPFAKAAPYRQANEWNNKKPPFDRASQFNRQFSATGDKRPQTTTANVPVPTPSVDESSKVSTTTVDRVQYPSQWYDFRSALERNKSLLNDWHAEFYRTMPVKDLRSRQFRSLAADVSDLLPFLVRLIQPKIRAINLQLFSAAEKKELSRAIDAMLTYNLEYRQVLEADLKTSAFGHSAGQQTRHFVDTEDDAHRFDSDEPRPAVLAPPINKYTYVLHPDLEALVKFNVASAIKSANPFVQSGSGQLSYTAKQVIAREMEVERLRKHEAMELDNNWKSIASQTTRPETSASGQSEQDSKLQLQVDLKSVETASLPASAPVAGSKWQLPTLKIPFKPNFDDQTGENAPASSILRWMIPKSKTAEKRNVNSKQ